MKKLSAVVFCIVIYSVFYSSPAYSKMRTYTDEKGETWQIIEPDEKPKPTPESLEKIKQKANNEIREILGWIKKGMVGEWLNGKHQIIDVEIMDITIEGDSEDDLTALVILKATVSGFVAGNDKMILKKFLKRRYGGKWVEWKR